MASKKVFALLILIAVLHIENRLVHSLPAEILQSGKPEDNRVQKNDDTPKVDENSKDVKVDEKPNDDTDTKNYKKHVEDKEKTVYKNKGLPSKKKNFLQKDPANFYEDYKKPFYDPFYKKDKKYWDPIGFSKKYKEPHIDPFYDPFHKKDKKYWDPIYFSKIYKGPYFDKFDKKYKKDWYHKGYTGPASDPLPKTNKKLPAHIDYHDEWKGPYGEHKGKKPFDQPLAYGSDEEIKSGVWKGPCRPCRWRRALITNWWKEKSPITGKIIIEKKTEWGPIINIKEWNECIEYNEHCMKKPKHKYYEDEPYVVP